jgi:hypothetical protein
MFFGECFRSFFTDFYAIWIIINYMVLSTSRRSMPPQRAERRSQEVTQSSIHGPRLGSRVLPVAVSAVGRGARVRVSGRVVRMVVRICIVYG